mmetsp:Transcript_8301/g.13874  ORF Transcript_8301/g.13874 Transcript_8301/m.13874 type:complete len:315 (-) Transcript_8301:718-1662(-)
MCCLEYFKNFYNDDEFRTQRYAPLLPKVLEISNRMFLKYTSLGEESFSGLTSSSDVEETKLKLMNEIMELYRFIIERYAGFNLLDWEGNISDSVTMVCEQALFLNNVWVKVMSSLNASQDEGEETGEQLQGEQSIILSSVMRIMCHILAKMPFQDMPPATVSSVLNICMSQAMAASQFVRSELVDYDYLQTYLACLARVLQSFSLDGLLSKLKPELDIQTGLLNCVRMVIEQYEVCMVNMIHPFLVLEDLSIVCLGLDAQSFFSQIVFNGQTSFLKQELFDKAIQGEEEVLVFLETYFNLLKCIAILVEDPLQI